MEEVPVPKPGPGEVLVKVIFLDTLVALDPTPFE